MLWQKRFGMEISMKMIGVCGGDARNRYLAKLLMKRGYPVCTYDLSLDAGHSVQEPEEFKKWVREVQVLVGATPLQRYLLPQCDAKQTKELFEAIWRKGMYFFAGGIPAAWRTPAEGAGVRCIDFLQQEEYRTVNAELTAEGTLCEVIARYPGGIKGTPILVTGYGSCGRTIAKALHSLGARVTVCVRRMEMAWQAVLDGLKSCYFEYIKECLPDFDIIINTVPECVLGKAEIECIRTSAFLFEIASGVGGFEQEAIKQSGRQLFFCPGLPGKYAPLRCAQGMLEIIERIGIGQESRDEVV